MAGMQRLGTGISAEFAEKNNNAPVASNDLANKAYVDSVAMGLSPKGSCLVATVAALPAFTYANGALGVGATITQNAPFSALSIDGVTPAVSDRVLIKDETAGNAPYNGIYTVTQVGSGAVPFILTRATDNDQAAEFPGAFTFVTSGAVNSGAGFVCTNTAPVVVGTTPIVWTQFSGAGQITAGAGLTKTGNTLNVGAGDGIQVDADSVTIKLDGVTLTKSVAGLKVTDATFIRADGTVPFTAAQSMGTHKLTDVVDPTNPQEAATKNYVDTSVSAAAVGDLGLGMYGAGQNGSLTLVANTNLADNVNIRQYTDVTLSTFTLGIVTDDGYLHLYINGTLNGNGGSISTRTDIQTAGTAGTAGGTTNTGGAGGLTRAALYVYARAITGTVTLTSAGTAGPNGGDATAVSASVNGGAGGNAASAQPRIYGAVVSQGAAQGAGAGANSSSVGAGGGAGGAGGTNSAVPANLSFLNDILRMIYASGDSQTSLAATRVFYSCAGGGGGGGAQSVHPAVNNAAAGGGGGGGGAASFLAAGGTGGNGGGRGATSNNNSAGGGGGGGGGGGAAGLVICITDSAPSTLTVTAAGGAGGNGGNAFSSLASDGGGGGGGGGAGGLALLIANKGNTATVTASGGAAGALGLGAAGGNNGVAGSAGGNGYTWNLARTA